MNEKIEQIFTPIWKPIVYVAIAGSVFGSCNKLSSYIAHTAKNAMGILFSESQYERFTYTPKQILEEYEDLIHSGQIEETIGKYGDVRFGKTFTPHYAGKAPDGARPKSKIQDFDGDGKPDLFFIDSNGDMYFLKNNITKETLSKSKSLSSIYTGRVARELIELDKSGADSIEWKAHARSCLTHLSEEGIDSLYALSGKIQHPPQKKIAWYDPMTWSDKKRGGPDKKTPPDSLDNELRRLMRSLN